MPIFIGLFSDFGRSYDRLSSKENRESRRNCREDDGRQGVGTEKANRFDNRIYRMESGLNFVLIRFFIL
jgi:hypothetical protein